MFAEVLSGDAVMIGNSSLSCASGTSVGNGSARVTCETARETRIALPGNAQYNNNWNMTFVDQDQVNLPGTFDENSSAARLTIPVGAEVRFAALYWSGRQQPSTSAQTVLLATGPYGSVPNQFGEYQQVTASSIRSASGTYQSYADVTDLITASGDIWVAGIAGSTSSGDHAGWSLAVVWEDNGPDRNIAVFDSFEFVNPTTTANGPIRLDVEGLVSPANGSIRLSLVGYDGDLAATGDTVTVTTYDEFDTPSDGSLYSDAVNPNNDIFNSTISQLGVLVNDQPNALQPNYRNTFGIDIDTIEIAAPNAVRVEFDFTTGGEWYWVGPMLVVGDR